MEQYGIFIELMKKVKMNETFNFYGSPSHPLSIGEFIILWYENPTVVYGVGQVTNIYKDNSYQAVRVH